MAAYVLAAGVALLVLALGAAVAAVHYLINARRRPDALELLGVSSTYPRTSLPEKNIDAYLKLKEKLRRDHAKAGDADASWMSQLPLQAKDMLKYRLMQRAIEDMSCLQKIDADARGYWRLFSKGIITKTFWSSVVDAERELSQELEAVKAEASFVEPGQDPQGIISEAMQFILRFGDRLPSAAEMGTADAINDLMKHLPPPGHPALGALGGLGGGPPVPGLPHPQMPDGRAPAAAVGTGDGYDWKQDADELEVSVSVPNSVTR